MSAPELDEERGEEGPPDEVCLGKDEKVTDDEEEQERDVGERDAGNEEQKETEMLPGEERGEDAEMLKGYDVQETSIDISQVSIIRLIFIASMLKKFLKEVEKNASCLQSPYSTRWECSSGGEVASVPMVKIVSMPSCSILRSARLLTWRRRPSI